MALVSTLLTIDTIVSVFDFLSDAKDSALFVNRLLTGGRYQQLLNCLLKGLDKVKKSPDITSKEIKDATKLLRERLDKNKSHNVLAFIQSAKFLLSTDPQLFTKLLGKLSSDINLNINDSNQLMIANKIFAEKVKYEIITLSKNEDWQLLLIEILQYQYENSNTQLKDINPYFAKF